MPTPMPIPPRISVFAVRLIALALIARVGLATARPSTAQETTTHQAMATPQTGSDATSWGPLQHAMTPVLEADDQSSMKIQLEFEWPPGNLFLSPQRRLFLVATDGGRSQQSGWVAWVAPMLKGPAGEVSLLDVPMTDVAGQDVSPIRVAEGSRELTVDGQPGTPRAILTRTNSILEFQIPKGYEQLIVTAVVPPPSQDENQDIRDAAVARFAVYADAPPLPMDAESLDDLDRVTAGGKRDPINAVGGIELADDLAIELMGSEPTLRNLTNLDIDHRGRVWVCDVMNYRRLDGLRPEGDRILILEDTTGDGRLDRVKIYYQGRDIDSAMGICVLGQDVYVTASPNIWKFTDTDGDDKPDSQVAIFTKTGQHQHDHSAHTMVWGPDGQLIWNFGNTGNSVHDAAGDPVTDRRGRVVVDNGQPLIGGMTFRCDVGGGGLEVLAHNFRNPYETTINSYGTVWQTDNDDDGNRGCRLNYVMEGGNFGYRDELTGGTWRENRIGLESDAPRQHWHLNDPGVVPNVVQMGQGSPSGLDVYEGDLLPERFHGCLLHCDPGPGEVRAYSIQDDGAGYRADALSIAKIGDDDWFRPVDVSVAPDGSLFVTDWYDSVVGGALQGDSDRGRLFRIAPPGHPYQTPTFDFETARGCAKALRSPNRDARYTAWMRLRDIGPEGEDAVSELMADADPKMRARAMWWLGKNGTRGEATVREAASDDDANVRVAAIRLAQQINVCVSERLTFLSDDPSPAVRRELALALRHDDSPSMPAVWASLAARYDGRDRWLLEALGIGASRRAEECWDAWCAAVGDDWNTPPGRDVVWRLRAPGAAEKLVELIGDPKVAIEEKDRYFRAIEYFPALVRDQVLQRLLGDAMPSPDHDQIVIRALMRMETIDWEKYPKAQETLSRYVASSRDGAELLRVIERFAPAGSEAAMRDLLKQTDDDSQSLVALTWLLDRAGAEQITRWALSLDIGASSRIASLAGTLGNEAAMSLLQSLLMSEAVGHEVQSAAVRGMAKSVAGQQLLLGWAGEGRLPAEMKLLAGGLLSRSVDADVRRTAGEALPSPDESSAQPLPPLDVLVGLKGEASRGQALFHGVATCSQCHVVGGVGKEVGPNLSQIGGKLSAEAMYAAILMPSAGINHNYENHIALLDDGRILTGILVADTATKFTLRNAEAMDLEIDREALLELKRSDVSIMPEGLHRTIDQQGLIDLVAYLMSLK